MRRKSERNKSKSSVENKTVEPSPRKSRRTSRRRKRSTSHSSSDDSDDVPLKTTVAVVEKQETVVCAPVDEPPTKKSTSHSASDEDKQEQPIWKVKTSEAPSGEIQKLKICLQRPPTTPERTEKSPRRRRGKASSQSDDASLTPDEKAPAASVTGRRRLRRGSPAITTPGALAKDECMIVVTETSLGKGKFECSQKEGQAEGSRTAGDGSLKQCEIKQDDSTIATTRVDQQPQEQKVQPEQKAEAASADKVLVPSVASAPEQSTKERAQEQAERGKDTSASSSNVADKNVHGLQQSTEASSLVSTCEISREQRKETTSEQSSKSAFEQIIKVAVKEISKTAVKEISKTAVKETNKTAVKETSKTAVKELSEEASPKIAVKEITKTAVKETSKTAVKELSEEASPKTAVKEITKTTSKQISEEVVTNTAAVQETNKEALKKTTETVVKETPEQSAISLVASELAAQQASVRKRNEEAVKETGEEALKETSKVCSQQSVISHAANTTAEQEIRAVSSQQISEPAVKETSREVVKRTSESVVKVTSEVCAKQSTIERELATEETNAAVSSETTQQIKEAASTETKEAASQQTKEEAGQETKEAAAQPIKEADSQETSEATQQIKEAASRETKEAASQKTKTAAVEETKEAAVEETKEASRQETKDAVSQKPKEAAVQETKAASRHETNESVVQETKEAAVQETKEAAVQETKEAAVQETNEAAVQETNEATRQATNETSGPESSEANAQDTNEAVSDQTVVTLIEVSSQKTIDPVSSAVTSQECEVVCTQSTEVTGETKVVSPDTTEASNNEVTSSDVTAATVDSSNTVETTDDCTVVPKETSEAECMQVDGNSEFISVPEIPETSELKPTNQESNAEQTGSIKISAAQSQTKIESALKDRTGSPKPDKINVVEGEKMVESAKQSLEKSTVKESSSSETMSAKPTNIKEDLSATIAPTNRKRKWGKYEALLLADEHITMEKITKLYPNMKILSEDELRMNAEDAVREKPTRKEREVTVPAPMLPVAVKDEDVEKDISNIGLNRKISIVNDEASKLQPPPSPPKNAVSAVLYITNLVRPFTLKQLKELLSRTGTILDDGFWTDRIKSKCYVQYENADEAEATRNALHGVQWPIGNGKKLMIDFGSPEAMEAARNATTEPPTTAVVAKPTAEKLIEKLPATDIAKKEPPVEESRWEKSKAAPVREWDVGKVPQDQRDRSRSRDRPTSRNDRSDKRRHSRNDSPPNGDHISARKKKKDEPTEVKLMDDLFHKTKATPSIYWLPLTPEQIAKKQQQRLQRMAEHKRRMEESRRGERDFGRGGARARRRSARHDGD